MKATCSCMILVGNSEDTIAKCLNSAITSGCFERIILLMDTRTKLPTRRITANYVRANPQLFKIIDYIWSVPADFAAVRNEAIRNMDTDYGFWLDTDEELVDPEAIRKLLENPQGKAFLMWVKSRVKNGTFDMYQPRLFPIRPGVIFECAVFERLDWSLRRQNIEMIKTNYSPIWHTGYTDFKILASKNKRNLQSAAMWLDSYRYNDEQRSHLMQQYHALVGR